MKINSRTSVRELLSSYPEARELLAWYDIELDQADLKLDLGRLCASYRMDFGDLQAELETLLEEDDGGEYTDYDAGDFDTGDYDFDD